MFLKKFFKKVRHKRFAHVSRALSALSYNAKRAKKESKELLAAGRIYNKYVSHKYPGACHRNALEARSLAKSYGDSARHLNLARAFIKSTPYRSVERKVHPGNEPTICDIADYVVRIEDSASAIKGCNNLRSTAKLRAKVREWLLAEYAEDFTSNPPSFRYMLDLQKEGLYWQPSSLYYRRTHWLSWPTVPKVVDKT